jgi:hypothetical protein
MTFRKLDLFPSSGERGEKTPIQLGPLERANLGEKTPTQLGPLERANLGDKKTTQFGPLHIGNLVTEISSF